MKKPLFLGFLCSALLLGLSACSDGDTPGVKGYGKISPTVDIDGNVKSSRSRVEAGDITVNDLSVKLTSAYGSYSNTWASVAEFPTDQSFKVGEYNFEVFYGDEYSEGFEKPYFHGSQTIKVNDNLTTPVSLTAELANTMVTIQYTDNFRNYMSSWSAQLHSNGGNYIDYVSTAIYLMHFLHGGRGVAFGQKATMEDYLDCAFKALFRDQVFFMTGNGVQVDVRDIITLGTQTLTSFGDGLYLCAKDGKLIANVPTIGTGTPTSLTNGQFLYANNGKIGSRTIPLSALTDGVIKAGDSVTTANMVMNGYITSSSTELFFEVPLGKLITAASATLTAGTFTARTINGYAYNKASGSGGSYSGLTATNFTPVVALNKPSGTVRIRLLNSTKWTQSSGTAITNNTPISVVGTLTLKFA